MKSTLIFICLFIFNLFVEGRLNAPELTARHVVKRQTQAKINGAEKKFLKKEALKVIEKDGKDPELLKLTGMSKLDLWLSGIIDHAKKIDKHTEKIGTKNVLEP